MNNNELYHYGVKGMKWGVRKRSNALESDIKRLKQKRDFANEQAYKRSDARTNKNFDSNAGATKSGFIKGRQNRATFRKAESSNIAQLNKDYAKIRSDYKKGVANAKKSAVKKYEKKFDEAEKASNVADSKWSKVQDQYKSLGKTKVTRMLNAARNKTDAAKQYNKSYNDWEKSQNLADKKWNEAKSEYVNTGRSRVERIINNMKYGS